MNFKKYILIFCLSFFYINWGFTQTNRLLPDTLVFCEGDSAYIELKEAPENNYSITWFTPRNIVTNIKKIRAFYQGTYKVKVSYPKFKMPLTDSTYVKLYSKQKSIVKDTILCNGRGMWLEENRKGGKYLWSTGEITSKIKIVNAGKYFVNTNYGNCFISDTFKVKLSPKLNLSLPSETVFCNNNSTKLIQVNTLPGIELTWSNGTKGNALNVIKEGNYWLKSAYANCGSETDTIVVKFKACDCEMLIPNSFTPNEDFKNDLFFPVITCEYSYYTLGITDRWGNTVFSTNNITSKWDGRFKGNLCPEDIYIYKIESMEKGSDKKVVRTGHIALFR